MFIILMLMFAVLVFSGGGYYGHRRGYYGSRVAYGGIGLAWVVIIILGLMFLMPHGGMMRW